MTRTTEESPGLWAHFLSEQQRIATSLSDPSNQFLGTLAILGGVASALALSKLYVNLTIEEENSPASLIARRGLTAMVLGVGYVWWEMNKAGYHRYQEAPLEMAEAEFIPSEDSESGDGEIAVV